MKESRDGGRERYEFMTVSKDTDILLTEERRLRRHSLVKAGVFVLSVLALVVLVRFTPLSQILRAEWVDENVTRLGAWGLLVFVLGGMCVTAVGTPRQIVAFLGGYAYGALWGTLAALLATVLGCLISFSYSRLLGRSLVRRRMGEKLRQFDGLLTQHPFSTTILMRFMPFTNNMVTNLVAGVSSAPLRWYLLGSLLGYLPQTLLFALLGSGVKLGKQWQMGLSIALFLASLWIGWLLFRRNWQIYTAAREAEGEENEE